MTTIILECRFMLDRERTHVYLARKLILPGWYGRNLDALYDCLTMQGEPLTLVFAGEPTAYGCEVLRVAHDAAAENSMVTIIERPQG